MDNVAVRVLSDRIATLEAQITAGRAGRAALEQDRNEWRALADGILAERDEARAALDTIRAKLAQLCATGRIDRAPIGAAPAAARRTRWTEWRHQCERVREMCTSAKRDGSGFAIRPMPLPDAVRVLGVSERTLQRMAAQRVIDATRKIGIGTLYHVPVALSA